MALQSWLHDFVSIQTTSETMSQDVPEVSEYLDYVMVKDPLSRSQGDIPKLVLENIVNEKIHLKLQIEWFKEWYALLTDPKMTKQRRYKDMPWPEVSEDLSEEEKKMMKRYQDGFQRVWQRIQSHSVLVYQIQRLYKTFVSERNVRWSDQAYDQEPIDITEGRKEQPGNEDYLDEMRAAMTKLTDIEQLLLDRKLSSLQNKIKHLEEELGKVQNETRRVSIEKENALSRLSQLAADRLRGDNSAITDLSDLNRPTKLAAKFNELYDNEWTDAFDHVTTSESQEEHKETINNLLAVLKYDEALKGQVIENDIYSSCQKFAASQRNNLYNALQLSDENEPRQFFSVCPHEPFSQPGNFRIQHLISEFQKATTDMTIPLLKKKIKEKMYHMQCSLNIQHERISQFVDKSIELCWYMNIQERPVVLVFDVEKGCSFRTDLYRHYTKSGTTCDYVVWPVMLLHDNGPLLQKGVIQPL